MKDIEKELLREITSLLSTNIGALKFCNLFSELCHRIDDIIDEESCKQDSDFILKTFALQEMLYSSHFYQQHYKQLYPTIYLISAAYRSSVEFEKSKEEGWKKRYSDVLRHSAYQLIVLVVRMVQQDINGPEGWEKTQDICNTLVEKLHIYSSDTDFFTEVEYESSKVNL